MKNASLQVQLLRATAFSALLFTLAPLQAQSILTFDITGGSNEYNISASSYGDNITSASIGSFSYGGGNGFTPNVTFGFDDYSQSVNAELWTEGFNSGLGNVLLSSFQVSHYALTFTAEAGYNVTLESMDLGNYDATFERPINFIKVTNESDVQLFYAESVSVAVTALSPTHINFGSGVTGQTLTLFMSFSGNPSSSTNVGLDNITFSQSAVPEPSTYTFIAGLMVLGLAGARRRRAIAG